MIYLYFDFGVVVWDAIVGKAQAGISTLQKRVILNNTVYLDCKKIDFVNVSYFDGYSSSVVDRLLAKSLERKTVSEVER